MTTLTATRRDVKEINYVKAKDGFWYHDGFWTPRTLFENLANPKTNDKSVTVGHEDNYHLSIKLLMEQGFTGMTEARLEALPEGTYFTLTEDRNTGARHLFFKGHYDIPYEKIYGFRS